MTSANHKHPEIGTFKYKVQLTSYAGKFESLGLKQTQV